VDLYRHQLETAAITPIGSGHTADGAITPKLDQNAGSSGGFTSLTTHVLVTNACAKRRIMAPPSFVDYDGDGDTDVLFPNTITVATSTDGSTVTFTTHPPCMYRNDGSGTFTAVSNAITTESYSNVFARAVEWADLDGDGDLDVLMMLQGQNGDGNNVQVENRLYINGGSGTFTRHTMSSPYYTSGCTTCGYGLLLIGTHSAGASCMSFKWLDYDADGDIDVYCAATDSAGGNDGAPITFRNDNGNFVMDGEAIAAIAASGKKAQVVAVGDITGDGYPEILATDTGNGNPRNPEVIMLWDNHNGKFSEASPYAARAQAMDNMLNGADRTHDIDLVDIDNDGVLDVFLTNKQAANGMFLARKCAAGRGVPAGGAGLPTSSSCVRCPGHTVQSGNSCVECPRNIIAGNSGLCNFPCPPGYVRAPGQASCVAVTAVGLNPVAPD
jgi:hypothetical protein